MKKLLLFLLLFPFLASAQTVTKTPMIRAVIPMEYWALYWGTDNNLYGYVGGSSLPIAMPLPGGRVVKAASGCFNQVIVVDNSGSVWLSSTSNLSPVTWTQIGVDSTGGAINDAVNVWAYGNTYVLLRSSGLYYGGGNDPGIFPGAPTGTALTKAVKLTSATSTLKFLNVSLGGYGILAQASDSSLYQWRPDSGANPIKVPLNGGTGKVLSMSAGNGNQWSYAFFAVVQQTAGSHYGHPFAWGNNWQIWGSATAQTFNTPTDLYAQWGLKSNVSQIEQSSYAMHAIDSAGNMYGAGMNVQGEVGNGQEFVNRYTYPGYPASICWNFNGNTSVSQYPAPFQQIGIGIKWTTLYVTRWYGYYWYAQDAAGNLYSWGRGKTVVLGNGIFWGFVLEPSSPNMWDQSSPTLVTPMTTPVVTYAPVLPAPAISGAAAVITSSTTISYTGHPLLMIKAGTTDTMCCKIVGWSWVVSGPIPPSITKGSASSVRIDSLVNGVYHVLFTSTDTHGDVDTAGMTFTVSIASAPACPACPNCPPPVTCPAIPAPRKVIGMTKDLITGLITLTFDDNGTQVIAGQ